MSDGADDRQVRVMRQLIDELRNEQPPTVDWGRAEHHIRETIEPLARARRTGAPYWQRRAWLGASAFAAAAAAVVLMVSGPSSAPLRSVPEVGSVVSAGSQAQRFVVDGVATWTLAPSSRAVLRCGTAECSETAGDRSRGRRAGLPSHAPSTAYVVVLERGALEADVVPQPDGSPMTERFVVETAGVRVAVHGTKFTVERGTDEVTVEVLRGAVTVGPAGHRGLTTGHLLVAPARAAFSLDSARMARLLPPETTPIAATLGGTGSRPLAAGTVSPEGEASGAGIEPSEPTSDESDTASTPDGPPQPPQSGDPNQASGATEPTTEAQDPSAPQQVLTLSDARARMVACLRAPASSSQARESVRVTISSTVRLSLDASRRIVAVQFTPPLKPALQGKCAGVVLGRRLEDASGSASFPVQFSPH